MSVERMRKNVHWPLFFILVLGYLNLNSEIFFVVSIVYFCVLLWKNKLKLILPKVPGIYTYLILIIFGAMVGVCKYPLRDVIRDMYYVLPSMLWIFIAYYLNVKNNSKKIVDTLFLFAACISVKCIIVFVVKPEFTFEALRNSFGTNSIDVGFVLPIVVMKIILLKEEIFSKNVDRFLGFMMVLQIVLSFGRTSILQPLIELFVICFLVLFFNQQRRKMLKRIMVFTLLLFVVGGIGYQVVPQNVINTFVQKITRSYMEIDSSQDISNVSEAMNNWRAYEVQAAQQQWLNSNIFVKIFGEGLGSSVSLKYVPVTWHSVLEGNAIPLLHNGYYTLLPKGGLLVVFSLIMLFLRIITKGWRVTKIKIHYRELGIVLISVNCAAIVTTYVLGGPVQQGAYITWAILTGWICSEINKYRNMQEKKIC